MVLINTQQIHELLQELKVPHTYNKKDNKLQVHETTIEDLKDYNSLSCMAGNCVFHIDYFKLNKNKDILLGIYNEVLCVNLFLKEIEKD